MLRVPWVPRRFLERFDQHRAAQAAADADGCDAPLRVVSFQRLEQVQDDPRARRAHRVAEGDRAAVHVEPFLVERAERAFKAELLAAILVVLPGREATEYLRG